MLRTVSASAEHWPLSRPFRISRGIRSQADLVFVEVRQGACVGWGEGAPIPRYGDTVESCIAQIEGIADALAADLSRNDLLDVLPAGAARNAVDCALWDLEAQLGGKPVAEMIGRPTRRRLTTALTVGLGTIEAMREAAAHLAGSALIKVKVDADDPAARIAAVRAAAPEATLIVDANEAWDMVLLRSMQPALRQARVALLEQPLPAAEDGALEGFVRSVPICADESCHVADDVARLATRYEAVNIKLDKTGGLTAALDLLAAARARGMMVMTGCMICTSLSIAPAFEVAAASDFADLDGPLWLARDRSGGVRLEAGELLAASPELWGGPSARARQQVKSR